MKATFKLTSFTVNLLFLPLTPYQNRQTQALFILQRPESRVCLWPWEMDLIMGLYVCDGVH